MLTYIEKYQKLSIGRQLDLEKVIIEKHFGMTHFCIHLCAHELQTACLFSLITYAIAYVTPAYQDYFITQNCSRPLLVKFH